MRNKIALEKPRGSLEYWDVARSKAIAGARAAVDSRWLPWALIAIGILFRWVQFAANRSLWLDEAALALNIVNRQWHQLIEPLDYNQAAPIGFLLVEKLAVQLLGNTEYSLRLFPFLSGFLSIVLFYWVAKTWASRATALFALGLFSVSTFLSYFSSIVKQYESDVVIALVLMWSASFFENKGWGIEKIVSMAIAGLVALCFSHPSVFVLGGISMTWLGLALKERAWKRFWNALVVSTVWTVGFLLFYLVILNNSATSQNLQNYWRGAFAPLPPTSSSDIKWMLDNYFAMFSDPAGLAVPGIGAFAFLIGSASFFSRDKAKFLYMILPILLVLIASALHRYPFSGRLLLFLVPSLLLLVAEGVTRIAEGLENWSAPAYIAVAVLMFLPPLLSGTPYNPGFADEIRPAMSHIKASYRQGDTIYVYYGAAMAFRYYQSQFSFASGDYLIGISSRNDWKWYEEDLQKLRGKSRVWVVFSHVWVANGVNEEKLFLLFLDAMGTRRDSFSAPGASVYLYDLG